MCTSCVKGKAESKPHKRIERIIQDSELPIVQCDYLVLRETAASDGLKVLSMNVKSFGYGTSTVIETKGATDTFAVTCGVTMLNCLGPSDITLQCDPEPSLIKLADGVKTQTSRANSHPEFTQTITSEQRGSRNLSETAAGTDAHNAGSTSRPHATQTNNNEQKKKKINKQ